MNALWLMIPLLALGGGATIAVTRSGQVRALPPRLMEVQRSTGRWRGGGLAAGILAATVAGQAAALGRGLMLGAPLVALGVLLGVVAGELRVTVPPAPDRAGVLEVRRVRDYLPRVLTPMVLTATGLLGMLLVVTTALGSADDVGRAGRTLFLQCNARLSEARGPWPGSFYSAPLAVVVALGLVITLVALRQIVRRPRQGLDIAADDDLRRRAATTVLAAAGLLVAVPFLGVAATAAMALRGISCAPAAWTLLATLLLLLVPVLLGFGAWCVGLLLAPRRLPAAAGP